MSAARALFASALLVGCAEIVGIRDLPGSGDAGDAGDAAIGDAPACSNARVVISSVDSIDAIAASGGFVFAELPSVGLARCAATGSCAALTNILGFGASQNFQAAAVGANVFYTLESADATTGTVHRAALDGSGDQTLYTTKAASPTAIATAGPRTFWVDDDAGDVHCIGCGGSDTVWIPALTAPYALVADANTIYALAEDGQGGAGVYACGVAAACQVPTTFAQGLPLAISGAHLASDGTKLYVAIPGQPYVASIDSIGNQKSVTSEEAQAIAVDSATSDLFYAAMDGSLARVKTDGSKTKVALGGCALGPTVAALAFDATSVYALVPSNAGAWTVYAVPRQ